MASTLLISELVDATLQELIKEMQIKEASLVLTHNNSITWKKQVGVKTNINDYNEKEICRLLTSASQYSTDRILTRDAMLDPKEKQIMLDHKIMVAIMLVVEQNIIGGILLGEKTTGSYTSEDLSLLKILGPEISVAVQNSLSYEEIRRFNRTLQQEIQKATDTVRSVNEQMYMKNLELSETNKTLSLLRKIDDAILTSVTNTAQIGQDVANIIIADADFKGVLIVLYDKNENIITELATAPAGLMEQVKLLLNKDLHGIVTSMDIDDNIIVRAIKQNKLMVTEKLHDLITPHFTSEQSSTLQKNSNIQSAVVYPMMVHGEVIGAMAIGLDQHYADASDYKKDLVSRLVNITGIAIDNALLYQRIQDANERLKQLDELKDEFVSVASHELRTPMTAIKSYLWLALAGKGGELTEKMRFYLDRSYTSTNRLIKLVNDMLNVSRIESGRMSFEIQKVDMPSLVEEMISEVKPRADELGIKIVSPSQEDIKKMKLPPVLADPDKIKEIMINLIGNSLKFTQRGGAISISYEVSQDSVLIHVMDTGEGIEAVDITKLFQKFSLIRGSYQTNKQSSQGTGLGLYISKMIMKEHGGDIWAESPGRGKGATFSFSLKKFTDKDFNSFQKLSKKEGLGIIHSEL